MSISSDLLDRVLDPVGRALTPEAARCLLAIRADVEAQRLMDDLACKANEGQLTVDERTDYESLVAAAGLIAILQAKARSVLAGNTAA